MAVRARTAALILLILCAAACARADSFLTHKELVGRDGDTLVVLPPDTCVTVTRRLGQYAWISHREGEDVREVRVRQGDLDAARPSEDKATTATRSEKRQALYHERVPFDVYIETIGESASAQSQPATTRPATYRIRVKTRNLLPEQISNVRFEVHVYLDTPRERQKDLLWQRRILSIKPRSFATIQTPPFSTETLHTPTATPTATPETTPETPTPLHMRYAVRLFVGEVFIGQKTGVIGQEAGGVEQIDEKNDDALRQTRPHPGGKNETRTHLVPQPES